MAVQTLDYRGASPIREDGSGGVYTGFQSLHPLIKLFSDEDHAMALLHRSPAQINESEGCSSGFNHALDVISEFKRSVSQLLGCDRSGHARFRKGPSMKNAADVAVLPQQDDSFPAKRQRMMSGSEFEGHASSFSMKLPSASSPIAPNSASAHGLDISMAENDVPEITTAWLPTSLACLHAPRISMAEIHTPKIAASTRASPPTAHPHAPSIPVAKIQVPSSPMTDRHDAEPVACIQQDQESTLRPISMICDGDGNSYINNYSNAHECATVTKPQIYRASTDMLVSSRSKPWGHGHSSHGDDVRLKQHVPTPSASNRLLIASDGLSDKKKPHRSSGLPPLPPKPKCSSKSVDRSGKCKSSRTCHCVKSRKSSRNMRIIRVPASTTDVTDTRTDAFSWKKYGQKSSKGSSRPRCYYKCSAGRGCPAMKRIEWSLDDRSVIIVTYKGDHNHKPGSGSL